ncbi:MAG TPA: hypothetical protein VH951_02260 [Dehalococcoidia bacterium]
MEIAASRFRIHASGREAAIAAWVALVVAAFALAAGINSALSLRPGPNEYNLPAWEARNFANKWLYEVGSLFDGRPDAAQQDRDLGAFLGAVDSVDKLEQQNTPESQAALKDAIKQRNDLENEAEATIEGRITEIAKEKGLTRKLGPLPAMVWPPVDLEFTSPPRSLVTSPRDRIELTGSTLLPAGLDLDQVDKIENTKQAKENVSARAVPIAGVGAYPTIVAYDSDYADMVRVAAHEWTHNYLAFRPLGQHYYKNNDVRTINESVADLVGKEIADGVVARWPAPPEPQQPAVHAPASQLAAASRPPIDLNAELVKLRGEVDALLAQGKIDEAEKLMDDRRQYLAANGYYIRKINQAFFAFTNLYSGAAGSPGSVNPIGPKLDELRRRSGSLAHFLEVVGDVTSVADLDRALAKAGG